MTTCCENDCHKPLHARGRCIAHYQKLWRRGLHESLPLAPRPTPDHGTKSRYNNQGCRCSLCRTANAAYSRSKMDICSSCGRPKWESSKECQACYYIHRSAGMSHGTESMYRGGCRCEACRTVASAAKQRRRMADRVPCISCGRMVHNYNRKNPDKPPECHPCSLRNQGFRFGRKPNELPDRSRHLLSELER